MEPSKIIRISDSPQGAFELWVPISLIPVGLKTGNVIRVKSVVASILEDHRNILVPTDHSNILIIHETFKLYKKFHNKAEVSNHDLTLAILGCSNKPVNQRSQGEEVANSAGIKIQLTHVTGNGGAP